MVDKVYKSALEKAEADFKENKIDEEQLDNVERDEDTRNKLKDMGYTDDEIGDISGEDFELAKKFFERFPKKESKPADEPEDKPEEKPEE